MKLKLLSTFQMTIIVIFVACDSGVEQIRTPNEQLLSITSIVSPQDSLLTVYIFPVLDLGEIANPNRQKVKDALVCISAISGTDTLFYNDSTRRYEAAPRNVQILSGGEYSLNVIHNGLQYRATCTVPQPTNAPKVEGEYEGNHFLFSTIWDNPSGHKYFTLNGSSTGNYIANLPGSSFTTPLKPRFYNVDPFPSNLQVATNKYSGIVSNMKIADKKNLTIIVTNVDVNFYKFITDYQKYEEWAANNNGTFLPNFVEPKIIHTNIIGGVGVFAGVNHASTTIYP